MEWIFRGSSAMMAVRNAENGADGMELERLSEEDGVMDRCLDRALAILDDEKPTAVRQALAALLDVAPYKPELWPVIRVRLETMDLSRC